MARDDFSAKSKEILAKRVGYRCSNPNCRCLTVGPQQLPDKTVNIGVAGHICAASKRGPRYDKNQTAEERSSIENGIWLCQTHAKLIDSDLSRYTAELLRLWKELSEQAASLEIEDRNNKALETDIQIIKHFSLALDRSAFKDPIEIEGSMEDFYRAMNDTIIAFTTGKLISRDDNVLTCMIGKSLISDDKLRHQMDVIVNLLRAIRDRYEIAKQNDEIHVSYSDNGKDFVCFNNRDLIPWFDSTRCEVLEIFQKACNSVGFKWESSFGRIRRLW